MSKSTELSKAAKKYLIDSIAWDECDDMTAAEKIAFCKSEFERVANYPYNIKRFPNEQNRLADWLAGLPISIAYTNYDILQLAVAWGSIPADYSEKQAEKILENYFNFMAAKLLQLFNAKPGSINKLFS